MLRAAWCDDEALATVALVIVVVWTDFLLGAGVDPMSTVSALTVTW